MKWCYAWVLPQAAQRNALVEYFVLLVLLLSQAFVLLVGFAVVHVARGRPRMVATIIGVVVAAGVGAMWFAADVMKAFAPSRNRLVMRRSVSARFSTEPC